MLTPLSWSKESLPGRSAQRPDKIWEVALCPPGPCSPPGPPPLGNHQQDDDGGADGDQPGPDGPEAMRGNVLDDPLRVDARGGHG